MANICGILRQGIVVFLLLFFLIPEQIFAEVSPGTYPGIPDGVEEFSIRQQYSGIHFTTDVNKPFPNSSMNAFPNGKDSVQVILEAVRPDGTFSENQPLLIENPNTVTVSGPRNTCDGSIQLFVSSKKPGTAKITVKLANYPQIKTSFNVNFIPKTNIQNQTDANSFIIGQSILFSAQIDPVEARGLKEAKLKYVSIANFFLLWNSKKSQVIKNLECTKDGLCSAKIDSDSTNLLLARRRSFTYTFFFVDQQNNKFSKSFTGTLRLP